MRKTKEKVLKDQDGLCVVSGKELPKDVSLSDAHLIVQDKGFSENNISVVDVREHLKIHNIYRHRPENLKNIKNMIRERGQLLSLFNKINNQLLAMKRNEDVLFPIAEELLEKYQKDLKSEIRKYNRLVEKAVLEIAKTDKFVESALGVDGLGSITIANCLAYIDLTKAKHASSLWSYVGFDVPSYERYKKGKSGGGNRTLRTALYAFAGSQIKRRGAYRYVYDNIKARWESSDEYTMTRVIGKSKPIKMKKKDVSNGHRDGVGKRLMIKHFLADYWYVGRTLMGLETSMSYPECVLKGNHRTIMPEERGWIY